MNEFNTNEAGINLGKNDNRNSVNFNKFFNEPNEEFVVQTLEQSDDIDPDINDDTIYEIDVYNNLISGLSLTQQNNPKIQEKYLRTARHLINIKNKSRQVDLGDIEDYPDLQKIYKNEFNVSWIIPIVLDKKKIYKKLDISNSDNEVIDQYVNTASNKGIQYEDFFEELAKDNQYLSEYNRDKMQYKTYRKLVYDIDQPYIIKKEMKKKNVGYNLYLNQYSELLRYFNLNNKFWQSYVNNGPEKFSYEIYDENEKPIGTKEAQIIPGAYINVVGLLVLGSKEDELLDALNGEPWFDRIRKIGDASKIEKNESAIIEMKNHGLTNGDKIMILNSNSEPSIDGEYSVKIINENRFMVPVNTEDGKVGNYAEVYSTTTLNFKKIELNDKIIELETKEDYSQKYLDKAAVYIFPEEEINEEEWKQICKKVIPRATSIIDTQMEYLKNTNTIDEINAILKRFSIEFKNLGWDDYFTITEILEEKYVEEKNKISKFNFDTYYGEIMAMRSKIIGENKEEKVEDDIIFGNKYIFNKDVVKYYGNYPNAGTDVDSIASRYNWLYGTPDFGKFYFLIMELEKVKEFEDVSIKDIEIMVKRINEQLKETEGELKQAKDTKNCEKRKIEPVKIYSSFNGLYDDRGKITEFNVGDYAIIENNKSHENGMIYVWNGINWTQNILIKSLDDLCLLGVEKLKDFDLEKLHCLFKKACKDKKQVRLENKVEKLNDELSILTDLTKMSTKDIEKKLKEDIKIAELNLQIFMREIEDTRPKETLELYQQDYDPLYLDILKIPDTDTKAYLRNLLIKKDGIVIDKDIYSIRTGKKICCGHFYYQMKIDQGGSPEYATKIENEMLAIYGTEEENGMYFCNHDGQPLLMVDYDTAEGLSKTTGEVDHHRELVIDEEEQIREEIMDLHVEEREALRFDCSGPEIRNELLKLGFKMEQVAKAKDICVKVNELNEKVGIILKKREFINIITDVLQKFQKIPNYVIFKRDYLIQMKKKGVDLATITQKKLQESYSNLVSIIRISLIAARLLITYQTLIPPQYPTGKSTGTSVVFEGFQGHTGMEYLALLVEESKILPIHATTKNGKEIITYLQLGKIKEEIRKSYESLSELASVRKMKKDKKIYDSRKVEEKELSIGVQNKEVPKFDSLPKKYQEEVEKAKKFEEFAKFQKELRGRQQYIAFEIIKSINESVSNAADKQKDDPKLLEMSCCYQEVNDKLNYYKFISQKTKENIYEILEESRHNQFYTALFPKGGILMRHYAPNNSNFQVDTSNLGYNNEKIKKNLFLTYISYGLFKGEKHEYNSDGICIITGESQQDILKKERTDEEENDLLKTIIKKTCRKLIIGGSKEDEKIMAERDKSLIDGINVEKLKEESSQNLGKTINKFVEKIGKLLNRSSNKEYMNRLKEKIENLGYYLVVQERMEQELRFRDEFTSSYKEYPGDKPKAVEYIDLENERHRVRISNLKKYINNYFRKYISMISNGFDPTINIKEIPELEDLQRYIFNRQQFIKKYMTKRDSEIFKKLKFDISAKVISNISAETDIWDPTYSKIEKIKNFNLSNLADVLMYVLINNLDNFISIEFDKGIEQNKTVAQFIIEIFEKINEDENKLDFTPETFIPGDYRAQEFKVVDDVVGKKSDGERILAEFDRKLKRVGDQTDYEEVYDELEQQERKETAKLKFIKEYKDKFEQDPTENEIIDYLEDREKEENAQIEEDNEEWMLSKVNEEGDDVLEIGDGYGELPQGGEGGEEGDI